MNRKCTVCKEIPSSDIIRVMLHLQIILQHFHKILI